MTATFVRRGGRFKTLAASASRGDIQQMPDGRAGVMNSASAASGALSSFALSGQFNVPKAASAVLLDGGPVYWDRSAGVATYRKNGDRDFHLGVAVGDAAAADATLTLDLNAGPRYVLDLARDPFTTALVGTQALGGLALLRRGGADHLVLSTTNEAQKADALGVDGIAPGCKGILELGVRVIAGGTSSAPDFNVGLASGTHATDADSIAEHLFCHLDGNTTAIKFQSKDGTTTVAATDSLQTYTAGTRFEVWFDLRSLNPIKVYVNAAQALPSTVFRLDHAVGPLYLLAHLEKTADASACEVAVDWARLRIQEG